MPPAARSSWRRRVTDSGWAGMRSLACIRSTPTSMSRCCVSPPTFGLRRRWPRDGSSSRRTPGDFICGAACGSMTAPRSRRRRCAGRWSAWHVAVPAPRGWHPAPHVSSTTPRWTSRRSSPISGCPSNSCTRCTASWHRAVIPRDIRSALARSGSSSIAHRTISPSHDSTATGADAPCSPASCFASSRIQRRACFRCARGR